MILLFVASMYSYTRIMLIPIRDHLLDLRTDSEFKQRETMLAFGIPKTVASIPRRFLKVVWILWPISPAPVLLSSSWGKWWGWIHDCNKFAWLWLFPLLYWVWQPGYRSLQNHQSADYMQWSKAYRIFAPSNSWKNASRNPWWTSHLDHWFILQVFPSRQSVA